MTEATKSLDTIVEDIYGLFDGEAVDLRPEYLDKFTEELSALIKERMATSRNGSEPYLRMSNLGKPDRQLWFDINWTGPTEAFTPENLIKFTYGDILEHLILLFARQTGHTVEMEQAEVELDGVKGHPDAVIDGVVVDVKSAASHQFDKFASGDLEKVSNDTFLGGYMQQLAGYVAAINPDADGAFLVIDKTLGKVCLLKVPNDVLKQYEIEKRVKHVKEVVASEEVPARCYEPKAKGKSGNYVLPSGCSYCKHKFHCWSDANGGVGLRTYFYAAGPEYFTHVEKEPRVIEEF